MFTNLANELGPHPVRIHLDIKKTLASDYLSHRHWFFHHV